MLNVGPLELLVVLAVALVVVGPERLPELARSVGRALRQFRQVQDEVRDMVSLGVDDEVKGAAADFRKATGDLRRATDVRGAVRRSARRTGDEEVEAQRTVPAGSSETSTPEPDEAGGAPAARLVDDAGGPPPSPGPPDPSSERPSTP